MSMTHNNNKKNPVLLKPNWKKKKEKKNPQKPHHPTPHASICGDLKIFRERRSERGRENLRDTEFPKRISTFLGFVWLLRKFIK